MATRATAQSARPNTHGSRTMTITPTIDSEAGPSTTSPPSSRSETPSSVGVLRLRGAPTRRQRVMWTTDTVDNEGMGKKKSKICCIYHKPRAYDESSSESDSCDSDDDGAGSCCGDGQRHGSKQQSSHRHGSGVQEQSSESESDGGGGDGRARPPRKPRRKAHKHDAKANKYDVQPKPSKNVSAV